MQGLELGINEFSDMTEEEFQSMSIGTFELPENERHDDNY
jgi:hypothetical protein